MASDLHGDWPALPKGREWPAHMRGNEPLHKQMRQTYARIANAVAGDRELAREKTLALEWCRANGNPHLANQSPGG